jgi:hypothetical protein
MIGNGFYPFGGAVQLVREHQCGIKKIAERRDVQLFAGDELPYDTLDLAGILASPVEAPLEPAYAFLYLYLGYEAMRDSKGLDTVNQDFPPVQIESERQVLRFDWGSA